MKNAFFRSWFARQLEGRERELGIFGIVRVKLTAKLMVIAWTLMKNKEMFAYEKLRTADKRLPVQRFGGEEPVLTNIEA